MKNPRILLVSDDLSLIRFVGEAVQSTGRSAMEVVPRLEDVSEAATDDDLALVIVHLAEGEDIARVARLRESLTQCGSSGALLVVCDGYRASQARDALRFGAIDYLPRPLDFDQVLFLVEMQILRILRRRGVCGIKRSAREDSRIRTLGQRDGFLYSPESPGERVATMVRRVAPHSSTVLLAGETGSGKSRLAKLIHELSPRCARPFLVVNCGALSATLIESEMFGHARGAFTGADTVHVGKFAEVGDGTLFLDEIDTLPPALQAKLLRAVEERVFEPVGSNRTMAMRARLIVASNRPLEQEVKAGRFRSDLYFRLNVISIEVPPLRARGRDVILELSRQFLADFSRESHRPTQEMTPEVMQALAAYPWPGNVRELRNAIERAVALTSGESIGMDDLPAEVATFAEVRARRPAHSWWATDPELDSPGVRAEQREHEEVRRITEALERHGNNRRRAAADLGISRMTLYNKLHKYHLDAPKALYRRSPVLAHA